MGRPRKDGTPAKARTPRNRAAEMTQSALAFARAVSDYERVGAVSFEELNGLLEAVSGAEEQCKAIRRVFQPQLETLQEKHDLLVRMKALEDENQAMREKLRITGHSEAISDGGKKPKGRPMQANTAQQSYAAA